MKNDKYYLTASPNWAKKLSENDLLALIQQDDSILDAKKNGTNICYLYREVVRTSNTKNESYIIRAWELNSPDLLQAASISEFHVLDNEYINIHSISVVRGGQLIKKDKDVNLRILDNEQSSSQGVINNLKKINCIVNDLRLNDVFIFEYSLVTEFTEQNFLDKKYFRYLRYMPVGNFFYKQCVFEVINERKETLSIYKKYFRNAKGVRLPDKSLSLKNNENFVIDEANYLQSFNKDEFGAYVEIATKTTWPEIADDIFDMYQKNSRGNNLSGKELPADIKLTDSEKDLGDKIAKIIEYVQNEIVYLYDAQVMHGHVPESPSKTLEMKSGDCKSKSLLLVNLLGIIGTKAELILVNYAQDYFIPTYLPSPFVFNHAIVKINYNGKSYFIDPTWRDRCGSIVNRSEPFFYNFLSTGENANLSKRTIEVLPLKGIEQDVQVKIKDNKGSVKIETTHHGESADATRNNFTKNPMDKLLVYLNTALLDRLSYPQDKQTDELLKMFKKVKYKIVSDDKHLNNVVTQYECALENPYQMAGKYKVFKFYHHLDTSPILRYSHKDYPCLNFVGYPAEYRLTIESDLFVYGGDPVVKRETDIDNAYFSFSNKKQVGFKKVEVTSKFVPKTFGYIETADLDKTKADYQLIHQSNIGVGVVFMDLGQFLLRKRYWLILVYLVIQVIGYMLSR